jgi:hypothetical protein
VPSDVKYCNKYSSVPSDVKYCNKSVHTASIY